MDKQIGLIKSGHHIQRNCMKTRLVIALVLTICLLFTGMPFTNVLASESLKVGDNATATISPDGTVVYRGFGALYDYEYNESPWYNNTAVKKVVIGNGITRIGNCTFSGCSNLSSISLPNSLTEIGTHVFYNNTSLSSIVIPEGVTNLSDNVFFGCSNLKSVSLPQSMRRLSSGVFWKCYSLSDISFPSNLTTIGNCTFYGCKGLTAITIPDSVTTIEVEAFKSCSNLSSVTISGVDTSLHYGCFSECSPRLTIYGKQGSLAETYATDNSIRFQSSDGESENDKNNIKNHGEYLLIYNESDFLKISDNPSGMYKLAKDITLHSTDNVTYIDTFKGTLDGDGHTILVPGTALFKNVEKGTTVKNFKLELTRSSVKTVDNDFGPVAIHNSGIIENIETSGSVSQESSGWIGGIVGRTYDGTIKHCKNGVNYSIKNNNADLFSNVLGGITARMNDDAQIIECWNAGNLSLTIQDGPHSTPQGNSNGGIVGMDTYVDIRECANSGKISTYYNNSMYSFTPSSSVGFISGGEYSVSNKSSNNEIHSVTGSSCFLSNDSSLNVHINSMYNASVSRNISASDTSYTRKSLSDIEKWWDSLQSTNDVKVSSNNNLTFSVYDGAESDLIGTPLVGAEVSIDGMGTVKTDESGIAVIENTVTDVAVVNKKITITKPGYKDYIFYQDVYNKDITDWIVNPNKISVLMIPLKSGEDAFPYVSTVTLQAGSTTVRNVLDTSYVFDSRESVRNGKIRINAVWNGKTPKSYRIYSEDEKKSYTSEDGVFEFDMLNAFSSGSPIWVELIATDGTGIRQKTKIGVKQYSTGSGKKATLTLAEAETSSSLGNDIPLLAGESIDFKLKGIDMSASVSEGKVKIMLGAKKKLADGEVFSEAEWKEWKDACQLQPYDLNLSQWSNLMEAYDVSVTSSATAKAEIYGYLEGTWNHGGDTVVSGVIKLDASMGTGLKGQYLVGGIPVYANVSFAVKGNATGRLGFNWTQFCIDKDTTELSFTITPTLQAEGGVGVMAVATVGVSGEGSLPIKTKVGEPDAVNVSLKGKMSIKTSVLGFDHSLDLAEKTWQLYPETGTQMVAYAMQLNDFEVADRSYAEKNTNWSGGKITVAKAMGIDKSGNSAERVLASNIYPDAQIQMIETNQTRMLLWTEDDRSRQDIDRSKLVYSVYNETSGWSLPQAVADDGTADYSPTVVADDSHIYVSWQNNGKAYGTHAELADVSKETEICMSIWDDDNKSFAQAVQMSEDKNASYSPKIALNRDGNPYTVYVTNSEGNPFLIKGKNDLWCAVYDGATVNNMALVSDAGLVTSYSTKYTNQYELSYTLDVDGDYSTQDDRELYSVKNGKTENISKNSGMDSNVQYIDWNGKIYRFWYAGDSIVMADNAGKQTVIYKDETGLLTDDFSVITGDASQLAIVWTSTNEQGNKQIQGVLYNPVDNGYTNLVQLSDLEGDICLPSGVFLTDGSILFAYKKVIGDETDLCTYHCAFETDMAVEHAYCDEEDLIFGQKAPVNVEVKNAGLQTVQKFQVDIGGTKTEFSDVLMPGDSKIVTAYYEVPDTLNYGLVNVTVETLGDTEASNDTYKMAVGYTDVRVKVTDNNLGNGHIINVEASNDSYVNAQTKLNVYAGSVDGTLIKSIDFGTLQKGSVTTVDYLWNNSSEGYSENVSALYFVLETDGKERYTNNNYDFVAVGNVVLQIK